MSDIITNREELLKELRSQNKKLGKLYEQGKRKVAKLQAAKERLQQINKSYITQMDELSFEITQLKEEITRKDNRIERLLKAKKKQ